MNEDESEFLEFTARCLGIPCETVETSKGFRVFLGTKRHGFDRYSEAMGFLPPALRLMSYRSEAHEGRRKPPPR